MWVLSTARAELHEFPSPEAVPGGYAILSHVWGNEEQAFQITQSLNEICKKTGANPRDCSYPKIRAACKLAESHGYRWLWVDTSCIDKSSSADLSEAINSMYRYYSLAKMCYAYLRDVPGGGGPGAYLSQPSSAFHKSKWHTRGWTLQELIAPIFVLFLADNWTNIGTKAELADLLETITHIPADLVRLKTRLADYSLAQRMSWAASRETTRPEDRAYSLLGIFSINISTLYGEGGEQAFYRLQEKIMKRRADTTLFAWGSPLDLGRPPTEDKYLLAPSPDVFRDCGGVSFEPPEATAQVETWSTKGLVNGERSGTITFSVTPYGVLAHVPLIEHWYEDSDRDEVTAYLFWSDASGNPIGLRLKPCSTSADPFRPHYDVVKGRLSHLIRDTQGRLLDFRSNGRQIVRPTWQEIYITHRPLAESIVPEYAQGVFVPMNLGSSVPFRISAADVNALPSSPLPLRLTACTPISLPWYGDSPVVLQFESRSSAKFNAMLHLGRCTAAAHLGTPVATGAHWAVVRITTKDLEAYLQDEKNKWSHHDCDRDHINQWPGRTKTFPVKRSDDEPVMPLDATAGPASSIELHFDVCPVSPETTLITHISTSPPFTRTIFPLPAAPLELVPGGVPFPPSPWIGMTQTVPWTAPLNRPMSSGSDNVVPIPELHSPSDVESPSASPLTDVMVIPPPISPILFVPMDHSSSSLATVTEPPLEPEVGGSATAEGLMPPGSNDGRHDPLDRPGELGEGDGGGGQKNPPPDKFVPTSPTEPRLEARANAGRSEAIGNELVPVLGTETETAGQRGDAGGEELARDTSEAHDGQGNEAVDQGDQSHTTVQTSEGVEEGARLSGEASSTPVDLAGPSRDATPPPKGWNILRLLGLTF